MKTFAKIRMQILSALTVLTFACVVPGELAAQGLNAELTTSDFRIEDPETGLIYSKFSVGEDIMLKVMGPIDKSVTSVRIPTSWIENQTTAYNIVLISDGAFMNCTNLQKVEFAQGYLQVIGNHAFEGCTALTSVTLPTMESFVTIGDYAFQGCTALSEINLEKSQWLTTIGNGAFRGCAIANNSAKPLHLGPRTTSVGEYAFAECTKLQAVDLSESTFLKELGAGAFQGCTDLTYFIFNDILTELPASAFRGCTKFSSFSFTDSKITKIGSSAFADCAKLITVHFNDVLNEIGASAFQNCPLNGYLELPTGLQNIGNNAFYNCNGLTSVDIPATVQSIGEGAFADCDNLAGFTIKDSTLPIELGAGFYANTTKQHPRLYMGRDWNYTGTEGISNSICTLVIGNLVTSIPANAFRNDTEIVNLTLGSAVESIGDNAFSGCPLTNITLSPATKTIGENAFAGHHAEKISIGSNVMQIGAGAFSGVAEISEGVNISACTPPVATDDNTFQNYATTLRSAATEAYKSSTSCWNKFSTFEELKRVTKVTITNATALWAMNPGETVKLTAVVEPEDADMPEIFWRSTDPTYAIVDNEGNVTVLQPQPQAGTYANTDVECKIIAETLDSDAPIAVAPFYEIILGIESVQADTDSDAEISYPADIFNMQGIRIRQDATEDDVRTLNPGLYIIGSKKVFVK